MALQVVRLLGEAGRYRVCALAKDAHTLATRSRHCHRVIRTDFVRGTDSHTQAILSVLEQERIDVLLPVTVEDALAVGRAVDRFRSRTALPPLATPDEIETLDDKIRVWQLAREIGLDVPESTAFPRDLPDDLVHFPAILKPARGAGGIGCEIVQDAAALRSLLRQRRGQRLLLQRFIAGVDYGANVLCRDGQIIAHTVQRAVGPPVRPFGPARIAETIADASILSLARRFCAHVRWNGVANMDLRRETATGRTYLLEVNPRFWWSVSLSARAGINFPDLACRVALGEKPATAPARPIRHGVRGWRSACADPLPAFGHYLARLRRSLTTRPAGGTTA